MDSQINYNKKDNTSIDREEQELEGIINNNETNAQLKHKSMPLFIKLLIIKVIKIEF